MLEFLSIALMFLYAVLRKKPLGFFAWFIFGVSWLLKIPHYLQISDYYNTVIMVLAFSLFTFMGLTILRSENQDVFVSATSVAFVSSLIYFSFALTELKTLLITHTADMTVILGKTLGFNFTRYDWNIIEYGGRYVEIILACTGIESMALFAGIAVSTKADLKRRVYAFLVSVPVIYVLNLLRNVFITAAFGEQWFGPDSFYIAHHVISKILATLALIAISVAVFRFLPEFADLIFNLKDEMVRTWKRQE
ncbi:archaeosortase A, PGF-CTERM-specific [Geoglobus ahangari]|uniref:Archaeosortase A, PGF-CTERM-specific n=1 Tax=Geoglobus ahangari TaxID=113653 RepID=A0A0F7IC54_9EURY|nr:archaeosortase A [Geoglobus ahangari]AKG90802.1 archaeosortase A, PGF-CTERM-specific [Geoglobus ahangari]